MQVSDGNICSHGRISRLSRLVASVEELKKLGIYENTIIFFTSDNGPVTTGGAVSQFFENAKPFNQDPDKLKGSVYEGGIHVPMIISWPAVVKQAGVTDHICAAWDIFPTFCDITGSEHPKGLDGISILPEITGKGKQKEHEFLYWEFPESRGSQAVRMNEWKAVRDSIHDGNMKIRLFNLNDDIAEEKDLSGNHPEIVKQMEEIMAQEHVKPDIERFDIFKSR